MALWGGRFSSQTDSAVAKFTESISFDSRLYKYDAMGSCAHVKMLSACGLIPAETAEKITAQLQCIVKQIEDGQFKFDISLEDIHMHIESALIDALGSEGARVHTARSRNDQVALDLRLYLRDAIQSIRDNIADLQHALVERAEADKSAIMPGFTHLQHAQVVRFAHHLLAYVEMFDRDRQRLQDCFKRLNVMPLGAGAIAGTTLPIDRDITCKEMGFSAPSRNSMDSVADRDFAIELLSALSIFAMHISRISEDIILWNSQEFGFVELSDAFTTGSSLMPQKKNPDVCELSRGKCARVYGDLTTLLTLCKGLPLTYNRDLQEDKPAIFDAIDTAEQILEVYPEMIRTMKINAAAMRRAASDPALMATDVAEKLVELGVPFRDAHRKVGSLVKYASEQKKALDQLTLAQIQSVIPEATAEFTSLFDPERSVEKRNTYGGTSLAQVEDAIKFWRETL